MDLASRPNDPAVEELARAIYAMFPCCMRCGEPIASYEEADIRILTQRVVHRRECATSDAAADSVPPADSDAGGTERVDPTGS